MNILIIEDDPMVAMIHKEFYKRISEKDNLYHTRTLKEARQFIKQQTIDLVLLDNYLPDGKGVEILNDLQDMPVIMITAANDIASVKTALSSGVIDYLVKPFTFERFERAIIRYRELQKLLSREKLSQEALDDYLLAMPQNKDSDYLPKGLAKITLKKVVEAMLEQESPFTTQQIADSIDISRITIKKYLNYLVSNGYLHEDAEYLTLGRPASIYTVKNSKFLKSLID